MHLVVKLLTTAFLLVSLALPATAGELRLSVAASLTDVFNEICADYAKTHPGVTFAPNYGASGALAKQIVEGAPADLFVSANQKWMDHLVAEKRVPAETVTVLARNVLVFVGAKGRAASLADLPQLERVAIGSPKSVPAGQYAEQAMQKAGVYDQLAAAGKLVMAQDVRQALIYADRGEVDGAFVYRTDALLAQSAVILFEVPGELYDEVTYPMGLTAAGAGNPEAAAFFAFLKGPEARSALEKFGFVVK